MVSCLGPWNRKSASLTIPSSFLRDDVTYIYTELRRHRRLFVDQILKRFYLTYFILFILFLNYSEIQRVIFPWL